MNNLKKNTEMKSKDNKLIMFFNKYWFIIILIGLAALSVVLTSWGLWGECRHKSTGVFESIKLLFLHHEFKEEKDISVTLEAGRWLALLFFIWFSGGAVIKFAFPTWLDKKRIKFCFEKHIVIFGEEEIYIKLIRKIRKDDDKTQIVLIVDKEVKAKDLKKYTNSKLKIIEGNPLEKNEKKPEENILKIANIIKASKFFIVTDDDNKNVEIARNIREYLQEHPETKKKTDKKKKILESENKIDAKILKEESENVLRCYTLVKDNDYKNILEQTPIFKHTRKGDEEFKQDKIVEVFYFDGIVFNLNSVGIQYGINKEIQNILPKESAPRILIVGLNEAAMSIMLNLSHILTKNEKKITFHIIEKDKNAEDQFNEKYPYLKDFAKFDFDITKDKILKNNYASIFVCNENTNKAVNTAVSIRYKLQKNNPAIFVVTSNSDYLNSVFNLENSGNINDGLTFKKYNIKIFNRLEYFWDLIIKTSDEIEKNAERVHIGYKETAEKMREAEGKTPVIKKYEYLTETYKQSNRNAALDFYIKTYIAKDDTFENIKKGNTQIKFTENEITYLAEVEHRRWMLEKLNNGWQYDEVSKCDDKGEEMTKDETFKIHECLVTWKELNSKDCKPKLKKTIAYDKDQIKLMEQILNEKNIKK